MDKHLVDYLTTGNAWVLVGSGPSIHMGYPSWFDLVHRAAKWAKGEIASLDMAGIEKALTAGDFSRVFSKIAAQLADKTLLTQFLRSELRSAESRNPIYETIARWPVPVYLTTNWDDEINRHLQMSGETYQAFPNSPDHMSHLNADLHGAIVKLHGDLLSTERLVLTTEDYDGIFRRPEWEFWREKMRAVFQMQKLIIIGHSLDDPHIRHLLAAAKKGAKYVQPVIWIAPDVEESECRQYLEDYRIRVITYSNTDGKHKALHHLLKTVSLFVPSRESIAISSEVSAAIPRQERAYSSAAAALYVYNAVSQADPVEQLRTKLVVAALKSALPSLHARGSFSIAEALSEVYWPDSMPATEGLCTEIVAEAEHQGLFSPLGNGLFEVEPSAISTAEHDTIQHTHLRERFVNATANRIIRLYPETRPCEARTFAEDINSAMVGCFQGDGFAMAASVLKPGPMNRQLPTQVLTFLTDASLQYSDMASRLIFSSTVLDMITNPTTAESEYLGALSFGYCAFNYLGVFGEVAIEKRSQAQETVWILDSDFQIPALAVYARTHSLFASCLTRLRDAGIRLFTLRSLFDETIRHFRFAQKVIDKNGATSPHVVYAANGSSPYRQSNQFLEGFIRWQAAGNPSDWEQYLIQAFGCAQANETHILTKLDDMGVQVFHYADWPGFEDILYSSRDECTERIKAIRGSEGHLSEFENDNDFLDLTDLHRKAIPEAEAVNIVRGERNGTLRVLGDQVPSSSAWFISHTSLLNRIDDDTERITWLPEAFLRFAETLVYTPFDSARADRMFQTMILSFSQTGLGVLERSSIDRVFKGVSESCIVELEAERDRYREVLSDKYGGNPLSGMDSVSVEDKLLAALQVAKEVAQISEERAAVLAEQKQELAAEIRGMKSELEKLQGFKKKLSEDEAKRKKNARRAKSGGKPKKPKKPKKR